MTDFTIITDYNVNTPWVLTDATLTDLAVGKLASLGSQQGSQLRAQTLTLQEQIKEIELLRDKMPRFSPTTFTGFTVIGGVPTTLKVNADWDITSIAGSFPNRMPPSDPSDPRIQQLIDFYNGISQIYTDIDSTSTVEPNYFRVSYRLQPSDLTPTVIVTSSRPVFDPTTNTYTVTDVNGVRKTVILDKSEPFAVPKDAAEYQYWLEAAATARAQFIADLFNRYKLAAVTGDAIQWQLVNPNSAEGETFIGATPIPTANLLLENQVGRIVQAPDKKYYRITKAAVIPVPGVVVSFAEFEEVRPTTSLTAPLVVNPTSDTLRDIRSRLSEAVLQTTQRNSAQQLLVNKLLVSHNYHFDAATNVLKAFTDLRSRLAGNV